MEKQYNLTLTEQEISTIFNAVVERPFKEVAPLVAKLQDAYRQTNEQTIKPKEEGVVE